MLNELGIYIHIPFCKQKCYYCDFVSYSNKCSEVKEYIESLKKEIEEFDFSNYKVTSIYIGGGTPSYIDSIYIVEILSELKEKLKCNLIEFKDIEITIEVNPGTVDTKKLNDYKKSGINRLSIGLQSTKNDILKKIGRIHTYQEFLEIYKLAREIGFKNINIDLMIGIPGQKIEDLKNTLQDIIKLEPEHISVYSLIIEENTPIEKMLENGEIKLPDEDLERNMYWYVKNTLELNGYNHYELSNFAKEKYESRHNLTYWNNDNYYGFGAGASGFVNNARYDNTKSVFKYNAGITRVYEEKLSINELMKDEVMLSLRKISGINKDIFYKKYDVLLEDAFDYKDLVRNNFLTETGKYVYIKEDKLFVSNEIIIMMLDAFKY